MIDPTYEAINQYVITLLGKRVRNIVWTNKDDGAIAEAQCHIFIGPEPYIVQMQYFKEELRLTVWNSPATWQTVNSTKTKLQLQQADTQQPWTKLDHIYLYQDPDLFEKIRAAISQLT